MEVAARVTADVRPGSVHVPYFVGPMIPAFLAPHAELFEDAALPVRIEKV